MELIALTLIIFGILLLVAEIFIPSFGISGFLGIVAISAGVILTAETVFGGIMLFLAILLFAAILMFIAYRFLVSKKSSLILKDSVNEEQIKDLTHYIGKEGTALTSLRPAGTVDVDGFHLDVLTRGEFIKKGTPVTIITIQGKKVIVTAKG